MWRTKTLGDRQVDKGNPFFIRPFFFFVWTTPSTGQTGEGRRRRKEKILSKERWSDWVTQWSELSLSSYKMNSPFFFGLACFLLPPRQAFKRPFRCCCCCCCWDVSFFLAMAKGSSSVVDGTCSLCMSGKVLSLLLGVETHRDVVFFLSHAMILQTKKFGVFFQAMMLMSYGRWWY